MTRHTQHIPRALTLLLCMALTACSNFSDLNELGFDPEAPDVGQDAQLDDAEGGDDVGGEDVAPDPEPDADDPCGDEGVFCDGACFNRNSVSHCGGCDPCVPPANSVATACNEGVCVTECEASFVNRDEDDTNGCECFVRDEVCDGQDNDCDGVIDNGVANACGGCGELPGQPEEPCGVIGQCEGLWTCEGTMLVCQGNEVNLCGGCNALDEEPGAACGECGTLVCNGPDTTACVENTRTFFRDTDNDGFGVTGDTLEACAPTGEYRAERGNDCNDDEDDIKPGAPEVCNGDDDNCNDLIDEGVLNDCEGCAVLMGSLGQECGDECPGTLQCNGTDALVCIGESVNACGGCTPLNGTPGNPCNDCGQFACDGTDAVRCEETLTPFFKDLDGDSYGSDNDPVMMLCAPNPDTNYTVTIAGDCNDDDPNSFPGARELCDSADNNCNTFTDENCCEGLEDNEGFLPLDIGAQNSSTVGVCVSPHTNGQFATVTWMDSDGLRDGGDIQAVRITPQGDIATGPSNLSNTVIQGTVKTAPSLNHVHTLIMLEDNLFSGRLTQAWNGSGPFSRARLSPQGTDTVAFDMATQGTLDDTSIAFIAKGDEGEVSEPILYTGVFPRNSPSASLTGFSAQIEVGATDVRIAAGPDRGGVVVQLNRRLEVRALDNNLNFTGNVLSTSVLTNDPQPSIALIPSGGIAVAHLETPLNEDGFGIRVVKFLNNPDSVEASFLSTSSTALGPPSIVAVDDGMWVVWTPDARAIVGQKLDLNADPVGGIVTLMTSNTAFSPTRVSLSLGHITDAGQRVVMLGSAYRSMTRTFSPFVMYFDLDGQPLCLE